MVYYQKDKLSLTIVVLFGGLIVQTMSLLKTNSPWINCPFIKYIPFDRCNALNERDSSFRFIEKIFKKFKFQINTVFYTTNGHVHRKVNVLDVFKSVSTQSQ